MQIAFAQRYESYNDVENARKILQQAADAPHKSMDDLASIWCERAELEIRRGDYEAARRLMEQATDDWVPTSSAAAQQRPGSERNLSARDTVRVKLHKNARIWSLYLDLEESLGTTESVRRAYDRAISLKVATPKMILTYAELLEERAHFEDAFKAYEQGVSQFPWPHVKVRSKINFIS
jgi:pre-mRNA-splicing factor SYF1